MEHMSSDGVCGSCPQVSTGMLRAGGLERCCVVVDSWEGLLWAFSGCRATGTGWLGPSGCVCVAAVVREVLIAEDAKVSISLRSRVSLT